MNVRLFIAINFGDSVKNGLIALRDELRSYSKRGNFSLTENLHLTLIFLGECDAKQTAAAKTALDLTIFEPFEINIDRIGRFPGGPAKPASQGGKRGSGDIWWAGVRDNPTLQKLHSDLSKHLTDAGFTPESRKYSPHITLGREVIAESAPRKIEPFGETVGTVDLMKSERIGGKLTYTSIYRRGY